MFSSLAKKSAAVTLGAAVASVAMASQASAYPIIGNTAQDSGAQGVQMGSAYCTVNASDPVVVTVNGVRYARTVAYLNCNSYVHVRDGASALHTGGSVVTKNIATGPYTNRTTLSVIADRACNGASNRYWAGIAEFRLDMNRDGYIDALVQDASLSTLRSCGL